MKKLLNLTAIVSVLLLSIATAYPPTLVTFTWDFPPTDPQIPQTGVDYFVFYSSDTVSTPLTNWARGPFLNAYNNGVQVTNFSTAIVPGTHFFYLVSSNAFYGIESGPSNVTNTPPIPTLPRNLKITK